MWGEGAGSGGASSLWYAYEEVGTVRSRCQANSPTKGARDVFTAKHCGQKPVRLAPSAGESRTGVPFPRPIPLLAHFG
ncbi:hypothetical protein [Aneurinibacillus soli]|uniref:hypothetical protein n=1 Tax=Aneurinibacillus soli TaxID=1500254 RepID=UPI0011B5FAAE|nr:hypothetical protein [Aneurinibacillus soli]